MGANAARAVTALVVASALCLVLGLRVYMRFDAVRFKMVDAPIAAVAGRAVVPADRARALADLRPPFAVIARVRNESNVSQRITIDIDGHPVCSNDLRPGGPFRIDCAAATRRVTGDHDIIVVGPASPWTLTYLEIATHHGATRSHDLVVLPAGSQQYLAPSATEILAIGILLLLLFRLRAPPLPRWLAILHLSLAGVIVILFVVAVVSPLVSRFDVVLSLPGFVEGVAVLAAPRVWILGASLARWRGQTALKGAAVAAIVAGLVVAGYGRLVRQELRDRYQGNFSGFVHISADRFNRAPMLETRADVRHSLLLEKGGGYDAQFFYFETFDPFLRLFRQNPDVYNRFIDAPPYRYGRIGFSLLTTLFAADRWRRYPATMTGLILGGLFATALILALIARAAGASPWRGLLILIVPGFWQSIQFALPEPIAAAALLGGYVCCLRRRHVWAGLLFAGALLIRETGAIFVLALAIGMATTGRVRDALRVAIIAFVPLALWRGYVAWVLWPSWGIHGLLFSPGDVTLPFSGFTTLWAHIHAGQYYPGVTNMTRAAIWYPGLLASGWLLALAFVAMRPGAISVAAAIYATLAVSLSYDAIWAYVGNGQRGTYEMFLMLALLSIRADDGPRVPRLALKAFWLATAAYVCFGAFDAEYVREAVLWPLF